MNLFRKKTHMIASFGEKELAESPAEIQKKLESLLPLPEGFELRLSIAENTDFNMETLCALSYFARETRLKGCRVALKARAEVVENIKTLGLEIYYNDLLVGE